MSPKMSHRLFTTDRRGNVAMVFGLMGIPLLGVVGTAIDYARAAKVKSELQQLIDAAALAATSEYTKTGSVDAANERLRTFVSEGLKQGGRELLPPANQGENPPVLTNDYSKAILENAEFDGNTTSVQPLIRTRVPTTIIAMLDQPYFEVVAETKAGLAGKKLELSMMLDITGSMCDSGSSCTSGRKLDAMKDAAKDLVDIIFRGNTTNTRVAVVPFSSAVNVGSYSAAATGEPSSKTYTYSCGYWNRSTCTGTKYRTNCVHERSGSHKSDNTAPGASAYATATWSTSSSASCTPGSAAELLPLTNTRSVVEARINGLTAGGSTAGQLGTAWAWYALSDTWASFWGSEHAPEPTAPTVLKAAVLMTDGEYNTCFGSMGCTTSASEALELCTNMKAQGIRVFTVGFEIDQQSARDTLTACASPGDYHFPYNGESMREAFRSIGNALVAGAAGPVLAN